MQYCSLLLILVRVEPEGLVAIYEGNECLLSFVTNMHDC